MKTKKTVRKPKRTVETGTMWFVRGAGAYAGNGFLCNRKMSLTRAREEGVFIPERGRKLLGFSLPPCKGDSLRITWQHEPEPKPKKKPVKKAAKKKRAERGAKR